MNNLLVIKSSASGKASISNQLIDDLVERLRRERPALDVVERDLDEAPIPYLNSRSLAGVGRKAPETDAVTPVRALSDALIAEVMNADMILIGAPMYNLGIPSTLKSWFDHVMRPGATFSYGPNGLQGLVASRPVIVVETRGGIYSHGPMAASDSQEPHLRAMLAFVGLTDVYFVRVEGLAMGEAERAVAEAARQLDLSCMTKFGKAA